MNILLEATQAQNLPEYKWWLKEVIIPAVIPLIAIVLSALLTKKVYQRFRLPIAINPSLKLNGTWKVFYYVTYAHNSSTLGDEEHKFLSRQKGKRPPEKEIATIDVDVKGSSFTAKAYSNGRSWSLEGYIDGESILYVYKDKNEPNSFGSAFLKCISSTELIGIWNGSSPAFIKGNGDTKSNPFIVSGNVKWVREHK